PAPAPGSDGGSPRRRRRVSAPGSHTGQSFRGCLSFLARGPLLAPAGWEAWAGLEVLVLEVLVIKLVVQVLVKPPVGSVEGGLGCAGEGALAAAETRDRQGEPAEEGGEAPGAIAHLVEQSQRAFDIGEQAVDFRVGRVLSELPRGLQVLACLGAAATRGQIFQ